MKVDILYKFLILCIGTFVYITTIKPLNFSGLLWDLNVYIRAVSDYFKGSNPYRADPDIWFLFVYHPYVLIIFSWINKILTLKTALIIFFIFSTIFFTTQFFSYILKEARYPKLTWNTVPWLVLPAVGFGGAGILSFETGNITLYLHFFVLGVFFYSIKNESERNYLLFSFVVLFVSIIKPNYLAYLILLPNILGFRKALIISFLVIIAFLVIWLSANLSVPSLYEQFLTALRYQTLGKKDLGYSVFGIAQPFTGSSIGMLLHIFIMLAALVLFLIILKKHGCSSSLKKFIPLTITFLIFLNPRMKEYDFFIAILFSYLYLFLYYRHIYFKAVFFSWLIASVPLIAMKLVKLGFLGPFKLPSLPHYFQVLGFMCLAIFILRAINSQNQQSHIPHQMR